jgi:hypothetical protein
MAVSEEPVADGSTRPVARPACAFAALSCSFCGARERGEVFSSFTAADGARAACVGAALSSSFSGALAVFSSSTAAEPVLGGFCAEEAATAPARSSLWRSEGRWGETSRDAAEPTPDRGLAGAESCCDAAFLGPPTVNRLETPLSRLRPTSPKLRAGGGAGAVRKARTLRFVLAALRPGLLRRFVFFILIAPTLCNGNKKFVSPSGCDSPAPLYRTSGGWLSFGCGCSVVSGRPLRSRAVAGVSQHVSVGLGPVLVSRAPSPPAAAAAAWRGRGRVPMAGWSLGGVGPGREPSGGRKKGVV